MEGGGGHRRQEPEDLVQVENGPEARRPGLRAHPGDRFDQQPGHEEHALGVPEVGDRHHRGARPSLRRVEEPSQIERLPLRPGLEAGGGEQVVEPQGEREALLFREEGLEVEDAHAVEGRPLDAVHEAGEIEPAPLRPGRVEQPGDEDVLAARHRVGGNPGEGEQPRRRLLQVAGQEVGIRTHGLRRRGDPAQEVDGPPGAAPRGVDGELGRLLQPADAGDVLAPVGEPPAPELGLPGGELPAVDPGGRGLVLADPGEEGLGAEIRQGEEEVGEIALGVHGDDRDAVDQGFLEQGDSQAGLARAGHADDDRVGGEVAGVVEDGLAAGGAGGGVDPAAEVEDAELLEGFHAHPRGRGEGGEGAPGFPLLSGCRQRCQTARKAAPAVRGLAGKSLLRQVSPPLKSGASGEDQPRERREDDHHAHEIEHVHDPPLERGIVADALRRIASKKRAIPSEAVFFKNSGRSSTARGARLGNRLPRVGRIVSQVFFSPPLC